MTRSPVSPPRPRGSLPQLVCPGISGSSHSLVAEDVVSVGTECGDLLVAGFINFIQFGPIAEGDRGDIRSSVFNLPFSSQTRLCLSAQSSYSDLALPFPATTRLLSPPDSLGPKQRISSKRPPRWSPHSFGGAALVGNSRKHQLLDATQPPRILPSARVSLEKSGRVKKSSPS